MPWMQEIPPPVVQALAEGDFYMALRIASIDYSGDDFEDPDNFVHEPHGTIVLLGTADDLLVEIGEFSLYQVDTDGMVAQDVSIYQAYDTRQETFEYFEDLVDFDTQWDFKLKVLEALDCVGDVLPSGLLIVSELWIEPEYRGRDFGLMALKCIIQRFRMGVGVVAMRPFAMQFVQGLTPELREGLEVYSGSERACLMKVRAHFGRLGFKLVPGTDVMAMQTLAKMDNLELRDWSGD